MVFDTCNYTEDSVEKYIVYFMDKYCDFLNKCASSLNNDNSDELSKSSFKKLIHIELEKAFTSYLKKYSDAKNIDKYLLACVHNNIREIKNEGKKLSNVCPGCKHLSIFTVLEHNDNKLVCSICCNAAINSSIKKEKFMYETFAKHSVKGYKCPDCIRFIPLIENDTVSCPYLDCNFTGKVSELKEKRHPVAKVSLEIPGIFDYADENLLDKSSDISTRSDIRNYVDILNKTIDQLISALEFNSNSSTYINKLCMMDAYKNMIESSPDEMINYLIFLNTHIGIQCKIFQEFAKLLENKMPFSIKKYGKNIVIDNILNDNLCIFNGISEFTSKINEDYEINNNTKEIYIGNRKGTYSRNYYIGKIIDVIDCNENKSLLNSIKEYSFTKIVMNKDVKINSNVLVKHYRIPPHYQMGGMVYLNRIRRSIVDKVYFQIHGKERELVR